MMNHLRPLFLFLFFVFVFLSSVCQSKDPGQTGNRPVLLNRTLRVIENRVMNRNYEYLQMDFDFDQELFVNDPMVCPNAEEECDYACTGCDWTSNSLDLDACAPTTSCCFSGSDAQRAQWCEEDTPWTVVELGGTTETFYVETGEQHFFRFFVPDEHGCSPIKVIVEPEYGEATLRLSNIDPTPSSWSFGTMFSSPSFSYAQSMLLLCPVASWGGYSFGYVHSPGTYAFVVTGRASTAFKVVVAVGAPNPLPEPKEKYLCEDVPEEEFWIASGAEFNPTENARLYHAVYCLEDSVTMEVPYDSRVARIQDPQIMIPLPKGCHVVSLINYAVHPFGDGDLECLTTRPDVFTNLDRTSIARTKVGDDSLLMTACSDEPFVIICAWEVWAAGIRGVSRNFKLIFSTTSVPRRVPLTEIRPGTISMNTGLGALAATVQGDYQFPCANWDNNCNEFMTLPTSDPLVLWPPPGDVPIIDGPFDVPLPPDAYQEKGLAQIVPNRVTFVRYITKGDDLVSDKEDLLTIGTISFIAITNANGDPVLLPSNGPVNDAGDRSFNHYIPNIAISDIPQTPLPSCSSELYAENDVLINSYIDLILPVNTYSEVVPRQFAIDVFNSGFARNSCLQVAQGFLLEFEQDIVLRGQLSCRYDPDTQPDLWDSDPCCNDELQPISCCAPYSVVEHGPQFIQPLDVLVERSCQIPECAESFLSDIAVSFNAVDDPVVGCSSLVFDIEKDRDAAFELELDDTIRTCLKEMNYGDVFGGGFTGVQCSVDEDCAFSKCDRKWGRCALPSAQEVEDVYLQCYIDNMPSFTEEYIRDFVLNESLPERSSPLFFEAMKEAAAVFDCVNPTDAFDLSRRTSISLSSTCASSYVFANTNYQNAELQEKICPVQYCLGGATCRFNRADCYLNCESTRTFTSSEENCPSLSVCNTDSDTSCDTQSFVCAYCPDDNSPCITYPDITTQEECESQIVCIQPDGQSQLMDTEEECTASFAECTVDCLGPECRPISGTGRGLGTCYASTLDDTTCVGSDVVPYTDSSGNFGCFYVNVTNANSCLSLAVPTTWETCESMSLTECDTPQDFTVAQSFLGCFVDRYRECSDESECEEAGMCSDVDYLRNFGRYGRCQYAGIAHSLSGRMQCAYSGEDTVFVGCNRSRSEDFCPSVEFDDNIGTTFYSAWLEPATTREACQKEEFGRYGCTLPGTSNHQWFWGSEACDCQRGIAGYTWSWTDGRWIGGISRKRTWMEAQYQNTYEWKESLSFFLLEFWLERSVEQRTVDAVKSQVICESTLISSSLTSILCDCFTENSTNDCFVGSSDAPVKVSIAQLCADEKIVTKAPAGFMNFDESSIVTRCVDAELSLIRKSSYAFSLSESRVSFQFATPKKKGVVLNRKGATVGQLVGDGILTRFSNISLVQHFEMCLRLVEDDLEYDIRDFGYTIIGTGEVIPLSVNVTIQELNFLQFWCADLTMSFLNESKAIDNSSIAIFPITRMKDFEDEEDEEYSHQTVSLVYTLGACYCLDLFLLVVFLIVLFREIRETGREVPIVVWLGVILVILCVFRIAFCFIWPTGGFDDNALAEYIVFEIPTFLLFSVVILCIGFWRKLSRKSTFLLRETDQALWTAIGIAIFLVWCLFAIVAIVYSQIIEDNESSSPCPGRVEASNDKLDEDTRTLSIVYQSIVIFFTFIFAALFWFSSYRLFKLTSKGVNNAKKFIFRLGAVIVSAFMLRCVFFIILLAADFTSSIYLFIVLMLTEVLMIFFVQAEFNKKFFINVATGASGVIPTGMNLTVTRSGSQVSANFPASTNSSDDANSSGSNSRDG